MERTDQNALQLGKCPRFACVMALQAWNVSATGLGDLWFTPHAMVCGSRNVLKMNIGSLADRIVHLLAQAFRGLHWAVGITTLPGDATPREERSFVLMWLGLIVLVVFWCAILVYLLTSY